MHFLRFSFIKIAKDYLGELISTVQTLLVQNQYSYLHRSSSTVKQPWAWEDESRIISLSNENKQELWVEDSLKIRKTSSLPVFPKAPSSSLFFS